MITFNIPEVYPEHVRELLAMAESGYAGSLERFNDPRERAHYSPEDLKAWAIRIEYARVAIDRMKSAVRWQL